MKTKTIAYISIYLILTLILYAAPQVKEKDLPEKYQEWLKFTRYIMLSQEKDVFLELTSNRDRDIFIKTFWKQRDPTPGTPQNENKDEHEKRFLYANEYFRRGTPREGWMTDMGRMHIILGPPRGTEKFEGIPGIYPCQVWSYYGDKKKGLPTSFTLIFFQRHGFGEFKLYNSLADGPVSLLVAKKGLDVNNNQQVYKKIRELAPTLAGPSISMIPGRYAYDFRPSLQDNFILSDIIESPKKDVNPTYATHFLEYSGVVSTEYLTNYIESEANLVVLKDPILDINFAHFSISPSRISIDYFEPKDQYFCNFQLNVNLSRDDEMIYQYSKDFPFYFPPDNVEKIRGSGIAIQDSFPLIEGEYKLSILIQNSVGKEFSVFEKDILVPHTSETPEIMKPVLGYRLQDYPGGRKIPFGLLGKKILVDPQNTYSLTEDIALIFNIINVTRPLWEKGKVELQINGLGARAPVKKTFFLNLKNYPYSRTLGLSYTFPAEELISDYYEIKLVLIDDNLKPRSEKKGNFIISTQEIVPHPTTLAKAFPLANNFLYFYSLAYQYDKVKAPDKAEFCYKKGFQLNPDFKPGLVEYAKFLLKVNKYSESMELIEKTKGAEEMEFQYFLVRGKAYMGMERYEEAINNFLEGNKIYNSDTELLTPLGFCYYKIGKNKEALEVLKASLSLNTEQTEVEKLIAEIEKK